MTELRILINKNINYFREKIGLTPEDLSKKIDRNEKFIEKVENNEYKELPTIADIVLIAKVLNIHIDNLIWSPEIITMLNNKKIERQQSEKQG